MNELTTNEIEAVLDVLHTAATERDYHNAPTLRALDLRSAIAKLEARRTEVAR